MRLVTGKTRSRRQPAYMLPEASTTESKRKEAWKRGQRETVEAVGGEGAVRGRPYHEEFVRRRPATRETKQRLSKSRRNSARRQTNAQLLLRYTPYPSSRINLMLVLRTGSLRNGAGATEAGHLPHFQSISATSAFFFKRVSIHANWVKARQPGLILNFACIGKKHGRADRLIIIIIQLVLLVLIILIILTVFMVLSS